MGAELQELPLQEATEWVEQEELELEEEEDLDEDDGEYADDAEAVLPEH